MSCTRSPTPTFAPSARSARTCRPRRISPIKTCSSWPPTSSSSRNASAPGRSRFRRRSNTSHSIRSPRVPPSCSDVTNGSGSGPVLAPVRARRSRCRSGRQALAWIRWWIDERGLRASDFMVSEMLPGREFAYQSVWQDGELIAGQARERVEYLYGHLTPSGQTSTPSVARTVSIPAVDDLAKRAIRALDPRPRGVFCVDIKESATGVPKVTEINAGRFFTTSNFFAARGPEHARHPHALRARRASRSVGFLTPAAGSLLDPHGRHGLRAGDRRRARYLAAPRSLTSTGRSPVSTFHGRNFVTSSVSRGSTSSGAEADPVPGPESNRRNARRLRSRRRFRASWSNSAASKRSPS